MTLPQLRALMYALHNHTQAEGEPGKSWDLGASAYLAATHGTRAMKTQYKKGWEAAEKIYEEYKHLSNEQIEALYEKETGEPYYLHKYTDEELTRR